MWQQVNILKGATFQHGWQMRDNTLILVFNIFSNMEKKNKNKKNHIPKQPLIKRQVYNFY